MAVNFEALRDGFLRLFVKVEDDLSPDSFYTERLRILRKSQRGIINPSGKFAGLVQAFFSDMIHRMRGGNINNPILSYAYAFGIWLTLLVDAIFGSVFSIFVTAELTMVLPILYPLWRVLGMALGALFMVLAWFIYRYILVFPFGFLGLVLWPIFYPLYVYLLGYFSEREALSGVDDPDGRQSEVDDILLMVAKIKYEQYTNTFLSRAAERSRTYRSSAIVGDIVELIVSCCMENGIFADSEAEHTVRLGVHKNCVTYRIDGLEERVFDFRLQNCVCPESPIMQQSLAYVISRRLIESFGEYLPGAQYESEVLMSGESYRFCAEATICIAPGERNPDAEESGAVSADA